MFTLLYAGQVRLIFLSCQLHALNTGIILGKPIYLLIRLYYQSLIFPYVRLGAVRRMKIRGNTLLPILTSLVNGERACEHEMAIYIIMSCNVAIKRRHYIWKTCPSVSELAFSFCKGTWYSICIYQRRNSKLPVIYCNPHYFIIVYEVMQGFSLFIGSLYCVCFVNFIFVEIFAVYYFYNIA